jgi:hypothetical protein
VPPPKERSSVLVSRILSSLQIAPRTFMSISPPSPNWVFISKPASWIQLVCSWMNQALYISQDNAQVGAESQKKKTSLCKNEIRPEQACVLTSEDCASAGNCSSNSLLTHWLSSIWMSTPYVDMTLYLLMLHAQSVNLQKGVHVSHIVLHQLEIMTTFNSKNLHDHRLIFTTGEHNISVVKCFASTSQD